jgi:hypothetical protein
MLGGSSVGTNAWAGSKDVSPEDCPMHAPPIDEKLLRSRVGVVATSLSKDQTRAAVLLKDGQSVQIYHIGCEHVGFQAVRWIDELPKTPALQLEAIRQLIHIGLQDPGLKNMPLKQANFTVEKTASLVYFKHKKEELDASFTWQDNGRYLLSVSYALPY